MYFLDTDTCIYSLKGKYPNIQTQISKTKPSKIKIASIVKAELLLGARKSDNPKKTLKIVEAFLSPFEIIGFCSESSTHYAEIRGTLEEKENIIGPNDLILASTVSANRGILVSHNIKEFSRVKGLKLEDWAK